MSIAGFFSDRIDFRLPHPPLDTSVLFVAHDAISFCLKLLRDSPPNGFALGTAREDEITRQLHWILENRVRTSNEVAGFDERIFRRIWRAPEFTNFDGRHPGKKPDLVFELSRDEPLVLSSHDGLFVECKPVGVSHSISRNYCDEGAARFVQGDYAWAMQEGMMLAYVRNNFTIETHLKPVLTTAPQSSKLGLASGVEAVAGGAASAFSECLHVTTHTRGFQWPQQNGQAQPIRIFHSWHECL
jgi:hypothetical protein